MMTTLLRLLAVSALAMPILVTATPSSTTEPGFNPVGNLPVPIPYVENILKGVSLPTPDTNANRLKRGLGPKRPNFKHHRRALHPRQSSTPCNSPTGYIRVEYVNEDGTTVDGYLGAAPNDFGEYSFSESQDTALRVQLNNCDSGGDPFDIYTLVCFLRAIMSSHLT